jgi:hypothetical protein
MKSRARIDPRGRLRGWLRGQTYAEFMMVVLPTISLISGIFSFAMIIYTYSFLFQCRSRRRPLCDRARLEELIAGNRRHDPDLRAQRGKGHQSQRDFGCFLLESASAAQPVPRRDRKQFAG